MPTARRVWIALGILVVAFLWVNMVRRAMVGSGQYDDFVAFSHDLIYRGINPYESYPAENTITKYPPFFALLFAPLVPLPTALGASIWFLLNLGLAAGATYLSVRTVAEGPGPPARLAIYLVPFVLASGIIGSNLETAQVNIVVLFTLCLVLYLFRRRSEIPAGLLLGAVTALKLTPGLFIAYFLYKRAWKLVGAAALGLLICWILIPPLVFGPARFPGIMTAWLQDLVPYLREGTLAEGIVGFRHTNQSLSAAFHRTFTETPAGAGRPDFYLNIASLGYGTADLVVKLLNLCIVAVLAWLCRAAPRGGSELLRGFEYSLVMIATLFISPISWINHYVLLLFPYAAIVYYLFHRKHGQDQDRSRRILLYTLIASFVLVSSSASRLMQALSLPFLGAVLLFVGLAYVMRAERRSAAGVS